MNSTYKNTVVGGTFDHFHKGHQKLLDEAFARSEHITIGVSTEKLYKDKFLASEIEPYNVRLASVEKYIQRNFTGGVKFVAIDDIFGTTLQEREIEAIFVTEDNKRAAEIINAKRAEKEFPQLTVRLVPLVHGSDGNVISSERIRKGEIDRDGYAFASLFTETLELPSHMRLQLREPIGTVFQNMREVISNSNNAPMTIAVGDIVSLRLIEASHQSSISVIDFKTRRHEISDEQKTLLKQLSMSASTCSNKAGVIEREAVALMKDTIERFLQRAEKETIRISGEEDLLTLPAILLAPLNAVVIYGQFDQGAVLVRVSEQKKEEVVRLLREFEKVKLASKQQ